jgi:hypothetical protein
MTRLFADMWRLKVGVRVGAGYADAGKVVWKPEKPEGLSLRPSSGDGVWKRRKIRDVEAVVTKMNPHTNQSRYLYFNVDDAFAYGLFDKTVLVSVSYLDKGCSSFHLEYDNVNPNKGVHEGAFRAVDDVLIGRTVEWRTKEFTLPHCRFMNRCNGADFRLVIVGGDLSLAVNKVELTRTKPPDKN